MVLDKKDWWAAQHLLTEAKRKYDQLDEIGRDLAKLLGVEYECGHISDAVFGCGDFKVEELLRKLDAQEKRSAKNPTV